MCNKSVKQKHLSLFLSLPRFFEVRLTVWWLLFPQDKLSMLAFT